MKNLSLLMMFMLMIIMLLMLKKTSFEFIVLLEYSYVMLFCLMKLYNFNISLLLMFFVSILSACCGLMSLIKKIRFKGKDHFLF